MNDHVEWTVAISHHGRSINLYTEGAWMFEDEHDETNSRVLHTDALAEFEYEYATKNFSKIYEAAEKVLEEYGYELVGEWQGLANKAVQVREVSTKQSTQERVQEVSPDTEEESTLISHELKKFVDMSNIEDSAVEALSLVFNYSYIEGDHHKQWLFDQIVRALTGEKYEEFVKYYETDGLTDEEYEWDTGIAP